MYQLKIENTSGKNPVYGVDGVHSLMKKHGLPNPVCVSFYVSDYNHDIPLGVSLFYDTPLSDLEKHNVTVVIKKEVFNNRL